MGFLDYYSYLFTFLVSLKMLILLAVELWMERAVRLVLMLMEVIVIDPTEGAGAEGLGYTWDLGLQMDWQRA